MNAGSTTLGSVLNSSYRYVIPAFQRYYVWGKEDWERLWEDIVELGDSLQASKKHFMGALVFVTEQARPNRIPSYQVIDGQQRLITLSLLLCALRDHAKGCGAETLAAEITHEYLIRQHRLDEDHFRVLPKQRNRSFFISAIEQKPINGSNITDALNYFAEKIASLPDSLSEEGLRNLFDRLCKSLEFVEIILQKDENPFQMFRSLNSTGVDLAESDLIRNFVFMHLPEDEQVRFDDELWMPLENRFDSGDSKAKNKHDGKEFSAFLRDFLMCHGTYVGVNNTFEEFERRFKEDLNPKHLISEIQHHAELYDVIRGIKRYSDDEDSRLEDVLKQLRQLDSSTTYPLVLNLLLRVNRQEMKLHEAVHCIRLLSGFILRRYVCSQGSQTYGKWFVSACKALSESPLENLREFLIGKGFPDDAKFQQAFTTCEVYKGKYSLVVLKALEASCPHKEKPDLSKAQIEHIMPKHFTSEWKSSLGTDAERIHKQWLDTPGNLTLTLYNPELGDKSFLAKRRLYQKSNFSLTRGLFNTEVLVWGEGQIIARGKWLAEKAKQIWIGPNF